jgi:hypothetical protein
LKLNNHESAMGPNDAQYSSAIALLRTRSCREAGRLRLSLSAVAEETTCNTHYFKPWKLLAMKLSFVPNEKNEVLFGAAISSCYWTKPNLGMTSRPPDTQQLQSLLQTLFRTYSRDAEKLFPPSALLLILTLLVPLPTARESRNLQRFAFLFGSLKRSAWRR